MLKDGLCYLCHDEVQMIRLFELGMREIMDHKFLESQKAEKDIGLKAAGEEWITKHYQKWLQAHGK